MKRFVIITVGLVGLYLLLRGSDFYSRAITDITGTFRKVYGALTQGKK